MRLSCVSFFFTSYFIFHHHAGVKNSSFILFFIFFFILCLWFEPFTRLIYICSVACDGTAASNYLDGKFIGIAIVVSTRLELRLNTTERRDNKLNKWAQKISRIERRKKRVPVTWKLRSWAVRKPISLSDWCVLWNGNGWLSECFSTLDN